MGSLLGSLSYPGALNHEKLKPASPETPKEDRCQCAKYRDNATLMEVIQFIVAQPHFRRRAYSVLEAWQVRVKHLKRHKATEVMRIS